MYTNVIHGLLFCWACCLVQSCQCTRWHVLLVVKRFMASPMLHRMSTCCISQVCNDTLMASCLSSWQVIVALCFAVAIYMPCMEWTWMSWTMLNCPSLTNLWCPKRMAGLVSTLDRSWQTFTMLAANLSGFIAVQKQKHQVNLLVTRLLQWNSLGLGDCMLKA